MMDSLASPLPNLSNGGFGLTVGLGRNDGVHRLYQGVFDGIAGQHYVYEFSWDGSGWDALQVANIGGGPPSQVMGLTLGYPRNDGLYRLYAVVRGSGVRESTFDGTAWSQTDEIAVGTEVFSAAVGQGQNDGVYRLYIAQLNPSRVVEATFDGTAWQTEVVGTPGGGVFRVRVGDGRGDGLNRVYSSGGAGVVEFTRQ